VIRSRHGRIETRTCQQLLLDKNWLGKTYQWSGLKSVIQVTAEVHDKSASMARKKKMAGLDDDYRRSETGNRP